MIKWNTKIFYLKKAGKKRKKEQEIDGTKRKQTAKVCT